VLAGEGVGGGFGAILLGIAAVATVAIYTAWGSFFGSACRSSLSAAGSSLAFWFATMSLCEALGWVIFLALPYRIARPGLALFLAIEPAEALRLGAAFLSKRASALGPEIYYWQLFFLGLPGILVAFLLFLFHSVLPLLLAARASRRA
jgi:hypothetical protein